MQTQNLPDAKEAPKDIKDTKNRILDAAENLFAESGIEGASLRDITGRAGVNLAAVNYHFQSKEALAEAVLARRIEPINRERLVLLTQYEEKYGERAVPIDKIIEAFVRPVITIACHTDPKVRHFMKIFGRCLSDPCISIIDFVETYFQEMLQRFTLAMAKSLPEIPKPELIWRMHFMIGTMLHTIYHLHDLPRLSKGLCKIDPPDTLMQRISAFLVPALKAPMFKTAGEKTKTSSRKGR